MKITQDLTTEEDAREIQRAKAILRANGYICLASLWAKDDIRCSIEDNLEDYPELANPEELEQAVEAIAEALEDGWDASVGINWEVIDVRIEIYLEEAFPR